jgi:UDP-4-amino-4,6-dideoxy-N-acetyl-beta-L-altrosamine transaminase
LALGLGPGDRLWTSPITFVASANCALYCGAEVDFVDIDPRSYNLCPMALAAKLEAAEKNGQLPKVVVAVHMCGQSCDMQAIHDLSKKYGFKLIEDASHAIGARYQGQPVGNGRYSDITIFSFHPVKIITSGEGGMAVTNDVEWAKTMMRLRSHGISSEPREMLHQPENEIWNYQQIRLGFNYRMTDIQAALGLSQMNRLDEYVDRRHEIAERYNSELLDMPITLPFQNPNTRSSYHLFPIRLHLNFIEKTQKQIYDELHKAGILVNLHYIPVYLQPYYRALGFRSGLCPASESFFHEALSIPMFSGLTDDMQDQVIMRLKEIIK